MSHMVNITKACPSLRAWNVPYKDGAMVDLRTILNNRWTTSDDHGMQMGGSPQQFQKDTCYLKF